MKNITEEINDIRRRAGLDELTEEQLDEISRRDLLKGAGVAAAGAAGMGASGGAKAWDSDTFGSSRVMNPSNAQEKVEVLRGALAAVSALSILLEGNHLRYPEVAQKVRDGIAEKTSLSLDSLKSGILTILDQDFDQYSR